MCKASAADTATAAIEAAGWSTEEGPAATKYFDSIVGPKKALIWVNRRPDQVGNFSVSGEYWSEGRNVAESKSLLLNVETPLEEIPRRISSFLQELEDTIQDTFAVRLLES